VFGNVVTTAESEFVTSYEAGVKGNLLGIRGDLNGFYYTIKDQQLTAIGGAGNFNQLLNADEGVGYGIEGELFARPIDNLDLSAAFAWNKTEINDPTLTVAPCGAPCTVRDPLVAGLARIDGNSFPNAPEWTGNVTARYAIPLASGAEFFALTDWAYKGDVQFFLYESAEFSEDGFWEGGLRLGYSPANFDATFAIYARNITDEERLIGAIDFNNLTGFVNNPRTIGAEATLRF
jgi:iron complex outermembrane recepter protein